MSNQIRIFYGFLLMLAVYSPGVQALDAGTTGGALPMKVELAADIQERIIEETQNRVLWALPDDRQVQLSKSPQRVVVLLTSLLELWYESGGRAVARCTGNLNVPKQALSLPEVGSFNNPNAEKIIALQPDLVVSSNLPAFRRLIPILEANKIEYAYFDYVNFYDYSRILTLFSKLNNTEDQVRQTLDRMAQKISSVQDSVRGRFAPKVLVMFSTANSVSCELDRSQTGVMLSMLGAQNIIPARFSTQKRTRIQFSLERIICLDPDIILLNTMGEVDECTERLRSEFAGNSAWSGLRAVQDSRFYVLPKQYFLYKPNAGFPDALAYLADLLYGKTR